MAVVFQVSGDGSNNDIEIDSTGTIKINGVKRYVANLTQSSTGAPAATVLENTLGGTPTWARTSAGLYTATLTGLFTANKTIVKMGTPIPVNTMATAEIVLTSVDVITLTTKDYKTSDDTAVVLDGLLTNTSIVIEVYP